MVALIIEDEEGVSSMLAQLLGAMAFDVVKVSSAESAEETHRQLLLDLVLLDLRLPGKSGEEWLASFRKHDHCTPVIVVSAVNDPMRRAHVLALGADDFLSKPFVLAELEARVRAVMRRPRTGERRIGTTGLSLNPARSEIRVGDVAQALTSCEFGILWYVCLHEGDWVEAHELSRVVLGSSTEASIESVRTHVKNLRHKMAHLSDLCEIETARMRGYRIVAHHGSSKTS